MATKWRAWLTALFALGAAWLVAACGDGVVTGGVTARIRGPDGPALGAAVREGERYTGVLGSSVVLRVTVSGADFANIQQVFPLPITTGVVAGVPVGTGRTLTIEGLNSAGTAQVRGEKTGLTIKAGEVTDAGLIILESVLGLLANGLELVDAFPGDDFDPVRWADRERAREIRDGRLEFRFGDPDAFSASGLRLDVANPAAVRGVSALVNVAASDDTSAFLGGNVFYDGLGDIEARVYLTQDGDAYYAFRRCQPSGACSNLAHDPFATFTLGTPVRVTLTWDGETIFTAEVEGHPSVVYDTATELGAFFEGPAQAPSFALGLASFQTDEAVSATVTFDDVEVDTGPGLVAYDDFTSEDGRINPSRWRDGVFSRGVADGTALFRHQHRGSSQGNQVRLLGSKGISAMAADVTVLAHAEDNSTTRARLGGDFYNDGGVGAEPGSRVGNIFAEVGVRGTAVHYLIVRCTNATCESSTSLTEPVLNPLGTVTLGSTHTLYVAWDPPLFTFQLDANPPETFNPVAAGHPIAGFPDAPETPQGQVGSAKRIGTRISGVGQGGSGYIVASFDNLRLRQDTRPDLIASIDQVVADGEQVTISYTVRNEGGPVVAPFDVHIWAHRDSAPSVDEGDFQYRSSPPFYESLDPGESISGTAHIDSTLLAGTAYAAVDPHRVNPELDEDNNVVAYVWPPDSRIVTLSDDVVSQLFDIGFSFDFFGNTYTQFAISSNGFITFAGAQTDDGCCDGETIPLNDGVNNIVAAAWADLYPPQSGVISFARQGTAPNRRLVVTYDAIPYYRDANSEVTTQIILYESDDAVEVHTANQPQGLGDNLFTRGVENADGSEAAFLQGEVYRAYSLHFSAVRYTTEPGAATAVPIPYAALSTEDFTPPSPTTAPAIPEFETLFGSLTSGAYPFGPLVVPGGSTGLHFIQPLGGQTATIEVEGIFRGSSLTLMPFLEDHTQPHFHLNFFRNDSDHLEFYAETPDGIFCGGTPLAGFFENDPFRFTAIVDNTDGAMRARMWVQPNHDAENDAPDLDTDTQTGSQCSSFVNGEPATGVDSGVEGSLVEVTRYRAVGSGDPLPGAAPFTPSGETLYHADEEYLNALNTSTGQGTQVAALDFSDIPEGLGRINSMALFAGSTMMGILNTSGQTSPHYLVAINLSNGVLTNIGSVPAGLDGLAYVPAGVVGPSGALLAADRDGNIYTVDESSGITTFLVETAYSGSPLQIISAMVYDEDNSRLLVGMGGADVTCLACVLEVNLSTGDATLLAQNTHIDNAIAGLAIRSDFQLFAYFESGDQLAILNVATGVATLIGSTNIVGAGNGIEFATAP